MKTFGSHGHGTKRRSAMQTDNFAICRGWPVMKWIAKRRRLRIAERWKVFFCSSCSAQCIFKLTMTTFPSLTLCSVHRKFAFNGPPLLPPSSHVIPLFFHWTRFAVSFVGGFISPYKYVCWKEDLKAEIFTDRFRSLRRRAPCCTAFFGDHLRRNE